MQTAQNSTSALPFTHLIYRKLPSGKFETVGELPKGTRKVRIDIDGRMGSAIFSGKRAVRVVSEAIATNHATADIYEIVPLIVDDPILTALRTDNLAKARESRQGCLKKKPRTVEAKKSAGKIEARRESL